MQRIKSIKCSKYILDKSAYDTYRVLNRPEYKLNWIGKLRLEFNFNKYRLFSFTVVKAKILVDARNPTEVELAKNILPEFFDNMPDVEIIIRKKYCAWKYE